MVTSEQQKLASRRLDQWIDNDRRVVTFRELSREVGCHVNTAKNLLLHHYNANTSLSPTYLLSGPLKSTSRLALTQLEPAPSSPTATQSLAHLATQGVRIVDMDQMSDADRNSEPDEEDEMGMKNDGQWPGNDQGEADGMGLGAIKVDREDEDVEPEEVPRWGMVLVQDDALEEKKELFERSGLNIHIYALAPARTKDPAQYLISTDGLRSHKDYYKPEVYGTITGEGFKPAAAAPMKDGGMDWGGKKADAKGGKKEESKKAEVKKTEKVEDKAEPKKGELEKTDAVESKKAGSSAKEKETKSTKAPAKSSGKAKKRVITSDTEEDEAEASPAPVAGSSKTPLEPTSSMARADDKAAMEAMMSMDFDMGSGDEEESTPKSKSKTPSGKAKTDEVIKIKTEPGQRKRRKVKQVVKEMNSKGYFVTRDEWREESYSGESEPEPEPAVSAKSTQIAASSLARKPSETVKKTDPPKAQSKSAPKSAAGKKGGQGTLTGFFKKL